MATALTLYEEVKHEISTQTKQRYGFDIFDLSLSEAVSAAKTIYDEKQNKSSDEETQTMSAKEAKELAKEEIRLAVQSALVVLGKSIAYELKDMFDDENSNTDIKERFKRVVEAVKNDLKNHVVDIKDKIPDLVIAVLMQVFESLIKKIEALAKAIKTAAKDVFDKLVAFIKGEIRFIDFIKAVIKSIYAAGVLVGSVALEAQLEAALAPVITPFFAAVLAPLLAITAGAFALVVGARFIDRAIDALIGWNVFVQREISKQRAEDIANMIAEKLPALIDERKELERLMVERYQKRAIALDGYFSDYQSAKLAGNYDEMFNSLNSICHMYGGELKKRTREETIDLLKNCSGRLGKLNWD